jgi:hypothetical protein
MLSSGLRSWTRLLESGDLNAPYIHSSLQVVGQIAKVLASHNGFEG